MKALKIVILLLILLLPSACALADQSVGTDVDDVEATAKETAKFYLANSCEEDASISVVRADLAHGGAWLVYLNMECSNVRSRYLVYVSADGRKALDHHVVDENNFE